MINDFLHKFLLLVHKNRRFIHILSTLPFLITPFFAGGKERNPLIYVLKIDKEIAPPVVHYVERAIDEAEKKGAGYIIIHINTFGGMVDAADKIRNKILDAKPVTIAFIDKNAASAGALISISCDSIIMAPGANIGAATVVTGDGTPAPDKYQSYMRSMMRSTAEMQKRNPKIAEGMVDPSVDSSLTKGKVITFTTREAMLNGYCDTTAATIDDILRIYNLSQGEIFYYKSNPVQKIVEFLVSPVVSGILILIIIFGIYYELQTPGIGFPLLASVVAAILYFAPLYLEGLAQAWEILIFVLGILLLLAEIFVTPGFGILGGTGIMLVLAGLIAGLIQNYNFDFTFVKGEELIRAGLTVASSILSGIILIVFSARYLFKHPEKLSSAFFLSQTESQKEGFESHHLPSGMIGESGICVSDLRPSGKVIIRNEKYDAVSEGNYIPKGSKIRVLLLEGGKIIVRTIDES